MVVIMSDEPSHVQIANQQFVQLKSKLSRQYIAFIIAESLVYTAFAVNYMCVYACIYIVNMTNNKILLLIRENTS